MINHILMRFKNKFLTIIAVFFILSCNDEKKEDQPKAISYALPASVEINPELKSKLNLVCTEWYNQILKKSGFSGGILVSQHGNTIFEKYEGRIYLNNAKLINNQSPLHIASVSKTFTAMAVLKLCQDKLLNLDDPFSKYFNEFDYPGVTIRTLLNHRSGLPNYVYFMEELGWDKKKYVTNQDVLNTLIQQMVQIQGDLCPLSGTTSNPFNNQIMPDLSCPGLIGGRRINKSKKLKYKKHKSKKRRQNKSRRR